MQKEKKENIPYDHFARIPPNFKYPNPLSGKGQLLLFNKRRKVFFLKMELDVKKKRQMLLPGYITSSDLLFFLFQVDIPHQLVPIFFFFSRKKMYFFVPFLKLSRK